MMALNTFHLLAFGHRGAGKTVFLAGSYAASRPVPRLSESWRLWFDCQNITAQKNLEALLRTIARTGKYPPPTLKVTSFTFRLQRRNWARSQTLCQFQWSDIPGEICSLRNPQFQDLLLNSHGGCLFVDAQTLAKHGHLYLDTLESLIRQIELISRYVTTQGLNYPVALILTKCDQITTNPENDQHLQRNLVPLLTRFKHAQVCYRTFYSAIPIGNTAGMAGLQTHRAALPFLWLTFELRRQYRTRSPQALATQFQTLIESVDHRRAKQPTLPPPPHRRGKNPLWLWIGGGLALLLLGAGVRWLGTQQKGQQQPPQTFSPGRQIVKLLHTGTPDPAFQPPKAAPHQRL